MEDDL